MKFYGLYGEKLSHSLSPQLHKEIYHRTGIQAGYKLFPFQPSEVKAAIRAMRLLSIDGINVTIPYKETVIPYLDELSSVADSLQVVNTIDNTKGRLVGYNTDYDGFGLIFKRRNWLVIEKSFVILGTGGAAKMAVTYLLDHGAEKITLVSRKEGQTDSNPKVSYTTYDKLTLLEADYLINTTPVGMYPSAGSSAVSEAEIRPFSCVIDLIYNPAATQLLISAQKQGKPTANGLDMLIGQAVRSVEIWEKTKITDTIIEELIHDHARWKEGK